MGSALHFSPHNGAESYKHIVCHTDQSRRKRLHIMVSLRRRPPVSLSGIEEIAR